MSSSQERGARARLAGVVALAVALCVYYLARTYWTPRLATQLEPQLPTDAGVQLFLRHLLTFSLTTGLICVATWWALARAGMVARPLAYLGFGPEPRTSIRLGAIIALVLSGVVIVLGVLLGERLRFHPDGWKIFGNMFSNYYEELTYRGLLLHAGRAASGSWVGGVLISSLVFGWSHGHGNHAVFKMVLAGVAGLVFGWLAVRTRSLGSPWVAHQLSDTMLDSL